MYEEINKIKIYARDNRIPIMLDDGIDFLCEYIKKNRIKNILEIGTAIGYSAIRMARVNKDIRIVGFQVLQRPTKQQAMAIYLARNIDYRKEMHCDELPRDKKAAFEIYDKMNGGELLFPDDYASRIATAIKNKYDQEKIINEDVFEDYCKEFALNPSKAKRYFSNLGYSITYDKVESSEKEKNNMQEEIDTEIIPWINEFIMDANPYHLLKKKQ